MELSITENDGTIKRIAIDEGYIILYVEGGRARVTGELDKKMLTNLLLRTLAEKLSK